MMRHEANAVGMGNDVTFDQAAMQLNTAISPSA
jgi:hypothetical protein